MKIFKHLKADWFKYGFETLAVVVGILVAFALDNWNESRKLRIEDRIEQLLVILKQEEINTEVPLDTLFGAVYGLLGNELNMAPFEALRSKGLEIISNDSIRYLIIQIYEIGQKAIQNRDVILMNINYEVLRPYYMNNFSNIDFNSSATPNDLNKIIIDKYYHNIAEYKLSALKTFDENLQKILNEMRQLIVLLDHHNKIVERAIQD